MFFDMNEFYLKSLEEMVYLFVDMLDVFVIMVEIVECCDVMVEFDC